MSQALVLMAVAGASDAVDGWLARRFDWVSWFGAALDPLADKILVGVLFVTLMVKGVAAALGGRHRNRARPGDSPRCGGLSAVVQTHRIRTDLAQQGEYRGADRRAAGAAARVCVSSSMLSAIASAIADPYGFWLVIDACDRFRRGLRDHMGPTGVDEVPR